MLLLLFNLSPKDPFVALKEDYVVFKNEINKNIMRPGWQKIIMHTVSYHNDLVDHG